MCILVLFLLYNLLCDNPNVINNIINMKTMTFTASYNWDILKTGTTDYASRDTVLEIIAQEIDDGSHVNLKEKIIKSKTNAYKKLASLVKVSFD